MPKILYSSRWNFKKKFHARTFVKLLFCYFYNIDSINLKLVMF